MRGAPQSGLAWRSNKRPIRKVLTAAGLKTVGEVRETSDDVLLNSQDLGRAAVARLRETLGLPSTDGVRPSGKNPT